MTAEAHPRPWSAPGAGEDDLRYPIGRCQPAPRLDAAERRRLVDELAAFPARFRQAFAGLDEEALDAPYREGGWTARQVAHHVPDSHVNAYVRFKLAATEERPTIRPYDEAGWARLGDSAGPVGVSFDLLDALHHRWAAFLRTLEDDAWSRSFLHPDDGEVTLDQALQLYVWHGEHHRAHVTELRERKGW